MKGGWNGGYKGDNGKGKGKGYQGQCWGCGQIGHKQDECPNRQQRVQAVQQAQQCQAPQTMGPISNPEPVHPNNVISPTSAGFTQVGSVPVNSVWMLNVEAQYKPVVTQNMFGAIESEDEDEEWPILKPSEPQIVKMAKNEAFWVRAQAKEKEKKLKAKEEHELMQSLIDSSEPLLPTTSFQRRRSPRSQRSETKVRFCEDFVGCNDDCCAGGAEDESSCKSDTPLLTAQGDAPPLIAPLGRGGFHAYPKQLDWPLRARVARKEACPWGSTALEIRGKFLDQSGGERGCRSRRKSMASATNSSQDLLR